MGQFKITTPRTRSFPWFEKSIIVVGPYYWNRSFLLHSIRLGKLQWSAFSFLLYGRVFSFQLSAVRVRESGESVDNTTWLNPDPYHYSISHLPFSFRWPASCYMEEFSAF